MSAAQRQPPGAWGPLRDVYGSVESLAAQLPERALVILDKRVAALHPNVLTAVERRRPLDVVQLKAGESAKSLTTLQRVAARAHGLRRDGTLVCIGGGTLGDLATVAAHLVKRGVQLLHVPSTLLAAVDSSVGGKGAVHSGTIKNALGVFHYPHHSWICPELFSTLAPRQIREGRTEAWKMAVCLDVGHFERWQRRAPPLLTLIRESRRLKARVCELDPYDNMGIRRILNFGHTFGHVLETLSGFRISHGDAVGLGICCALDVGRALGVTSGLLAQEVEAAFEKHVGVLPRTRMAAVFSASNGSAVQHALLADKKGADRYQVAMVLLAGVGSTVSIQVPITTWKQLLRHWRRGVRP